MNNNLLNIKTPAEQEATTLKSDFDLKNHGITNLRMAYWNLPTESLYEEAIFRGEAKITKMGALLVDSGIHTARAAQDKFVVREASTEDKIWWGEYNRPISPEKFEGLYTRLLGYLQGRDLFVQDCYAGADADYQMPVRIITEYAWHSHFARNMFITPSNREEYRQHVPDFTVIAAPSFYAFEPIDGTRTGTFIILNFEHNIAIIGGSAYGGEIKKSIFTVMNFLLPFKGVVTMHCSANTGDKDDTALFFGLSGTGKTTLSADPNRKLIGDDEHGWSEKGVFNFEGGCYAKVIQLSPTAEPEIYKTTQTFGTILENVIYDPVTRKIDLDDEMLTENTRASYPLSYISNAIPEKMGGHPRNIILLTCDAQGVLPPIARLTPEQTMYHFISGYTSKVGGTEVGLGEEPEITFSACFGAPFMVHPPILYADMLARKMERHGVTSWLLNTGWVGGPYGIGKRISIRHTRNMLTAALDGSLAEVEYYQDPVFGFHVPKTCPNVPENVMYPAKSWPSKEEYNHKYEQLAARFIDNFKKFAPECPPEVVAAGPKI
ncbi:MAG: phosphoenolpyruvate carboxykinase (ATP) [Anaerolineales bacterium]|nr:phosphoenolpyruvate carboxykinase (ATP) [Anaerolineales bacterium]